ncbi:MAG: zinc ribbon domain-containing protein [Acidobacteria bacterium]|nr:zinc ribbon domain-containing protein [Acidobacteriota bacterium]
MICRKCQAQVDDDLIFCTNCGARLYEATAENPTVLLTDAAGALPTAETVVAKRPSRLKWIALIVALVAIPASLFGVYLLVSQSRNGPPANAANKPKTPAASPSAKTSPNQNQTANKPATDANASNANANSWADEKNPPKQKTEIMNERIEIAPGEHYARPFKVTAKTAVFKGKATVLRGDAVDCLVYSQKAFDEEFPDDTYKEFGFGVSKSEETEQTMVTGSYVLVFVNNGEKAVTVQGSFSIE